MSKWQMLGECQSGLFIRHDCVGFNEISHLWQLHLLLLSTKGSSMVPPSDNFTIYLCRYDETLLISVFASVPACMGTPISLRFFSKYNNLLILVWWRSDYNWNYRLSRPYGFVDNLSIGCRGSISGLLSLEEEQKFEEIAKNKIQLIRLRCERHQ